MAEITPCLWFDGKAKEAAESYVSLLPDSRVDKVWRSPADTPSGPASMVRTVDLTVAGARRAVEAMLKMGKTEVDELRRAVEAG